MRQLMITTIFIVAASTAAAAGQYDGKWVGTAPEAGDCGVLTVTLSITNNVIAGNVTGRHGSPSIQSGSVDPDGGAHFTYSIGPTMGAFEGVARFTGNQFSGQFRTMCGVRHVTGTRQ